MMVSFTKTLVSSRARVGFTLPELLVFIAVLTSASMWLLPKALQARKNQNEAHAVAYLRMMASAEQLWKREQGSFVEIRSLAESVPNPASGSFSLRTPPFDFRPKMIFDGVGIGHRAGYRFRAGHDQDGRVVGCWAWPNLREYSGLQTYWVDFSTQQVFATAVSASWVDTPGSLAPEDVGLSLVAAD